MAKPIQWTRGQALWIGVENAERRAFALLVSLLVLVLLRHITGS